MKKICTQCKVEKNYEEFFIDNRASSGRYSSCKDCYYKKYGKKSYDRKLIYHRTLKGRISILYYLVKSKTKKHIKNGRVGFEPIDYSKEEFEEYLMNHTDYVNVFNKWKESGNKYRFTPTIDRINNKKDYRLTNIQCLSFIDNRLKQNDDYGYIRKL